MSTHLSTPRPGRLAALYLKQLVASAGDHDVAAGMAAAGHLGGDGEVLYCIHKGLVTALSTEEVGEALRPVSRDLSAAVRERSAIGAMQLHPVPPFVRTIIRDSHATAAFVAEGEPSPVGELAYLTPTTLKPHKTVGNLVITQELSRSADPAAIEDIRISLVDAAALAADTAFLDYTADGAGAAPGGILFGAPHVTAAGFAAADVDEALRVAFASFGEDGPTRPFILMRRSLLLRLALLRSSGLPAYPELSLPTPTLCGIRVLSTSAARHASSPGSDFLAIVDADAVAAADPGTAEIVASTQASIAMTDAPASGAVPALSLWQAGLVGVQVIRWITWQPRRLVPAAYISF